MSTIVSQTLSNGTVSTSTANCIQGSAKAWVNFNGTGTVAIRNSFNVSSVTRTQTGIYQVNFTTAMPNGNYSVPVGGSRDGFTATADHQIGVYNFTTTLVNLVCRTEGGSYIDFQFVTCAVFSS